MPAESYTATNHLNVILYSRISNPSRVLTIPKVLSFCKVARVLTLLLQWLPEKAVPDAELAKNTLVIYASIGDYPEPYSSGLKKGKESVTCYWDHFLDRLLHHKAAWPTPVCLLVHRNGRGQLWQEEPSQGPLLLVVDESRA